MYPRDIQKMVRRLYKQGYTKPAARAEMLLKALGRKSK